MTYKVTIYHHKKAYRRGDLESETATLSINVFRTKKAIIQYFENEAEKYKKQRYTVVLNKGARGKMPCLSVKTGVTWINENTGNEEHEYYTYRVDRE